MGFKKPAYTSIPNDFLDFHLPDLSHSEMVVFLYICRRTFGFRKQHDVMSIKQIMSGIQKKDGSIVDRGTGLSKTSAHEGIKGLINKGFIRITKRSDAVHGLLPSDYTVVIEGDEEEIDGVDDTVQLDSENTPPPSTDSRTRGSTAGRTRGSTDSRTSPSTENRTNKRKSLQKKELQEIPPTPSLENQNQKPYSWWPPFRLVKFV